MEGRGLGLSFQSQVCMGALCCGLTLQLPTVATERAYHLASLTIYAQCRTAGRAVDCTASAKNPGHNDFVYEKPIKRISHLLNPSGQPHKPHWQTIAVMTPFRDTNPRLQVDKRLCRLFRHGKIQKHSCRVGNLREIP